jgi:RNA polymerase sigma-70 factor, ECF subfamily
VTGQSDAQIPDTELLRRHTRGDHEAFGELFRRHRDRLWAVALRTLGDPEEAADALQDAMISAFRRAESFRGDSAVTTWLHRIVINACLDRARRVAARPATPAGGEQNLDAAAQADAAHAPPDPVSGRDTMLDVDAALRQLPVEQRSALVLVDMLGYPVADAAEVLGVSTGTVKSRCARGRARLAPLLMHLAGKPRSAPGPAAAAKEPAGPARADEPAAPAPEGPPAQAAPPGEPAAPAQRNRRAVRRVSSSQGLDSDGSRLGAGGGSEHSGHIESDRIRMPSEGGAT